MQSSAHEEGAGKGGRVHGADINPGPRRMVELGAQTDEWWEDIRSLMARWQGCGANVAGYSDDGRMVR